MDTNKARWQKIRDKRFVDSCGDYVKMAVPEKTLEDMTLSELRDYITFYIGLGRDNLVSDAVSYETLRDVRTSLNREFDRRLGEDFISIYNLFDKEKNTEKWNGDERYKILSYAFKGYGEFSVFKKTKRILTFLAENNIPLNTYMELLRLTNLFWYWDMVHSVDSSVILRDKNDLYQDEFVNYVFGEIPEAEAKTRPWFTELYAVPRDAK